MYFVSTRTKVNEFVEISILPIKEIDYSKKVTTSHIGK